MNGTCLVVSLTVERAKYLLVMNLVWTAYYITSHKKEICISHACYIKVCLKSIQLYTVKIRHIYWRRYKIQEALGIGQWCLSPLQCRHLGTSYSSPNHHQLPCCIFLNLINYLKSLSLSEVILLLVKPRSCRAPNLGCRGAESDLIFCQKILYETWYISECIVMLKLPITSCP